VTCIAAESTFKGERQIKVGSSKKEGSAENIQSEHGNIVQRKEAWQSSPILVKKRGIKHAGKKDLRE